MFTNTLKGVSQCFFYLKNAFTCIILIGQRRLVILGSQPITSSLNFQFLLLVIAPFLSVVSPFSHVRTLTELTLPVIDDLYPHFFYFFKHVNGDPEPKILLNFFWFFSAERGLTNSPHISIFLNVTVVSVSCFSAVRFTRWKTFSSSLWLILSFSHPCAKWPHQ